MGLLSGLQDMLTKANTGTPEKPSFVDRLNTFGANLQDISDGGDRAAQIRKAKQDALDRQAVLDQRKQLAAMADQLGLSPKEKLLFMVNPQAFGNLLRDQAQPYTLGEGQQRFGPDGRIAGSPKTFTFGDQVLSADGGNVSSLFTRPKTYEEMHRETQDTLNNDFARQRIDIDRGRLGVDQGRLGLERQREGRIAGGGTGAGGLGQMSTDQLISLARSLK